VLHGTVVDTQGSGSVALIQLGEEPARLLPVGASLGGFQLAQVAQQAVVMSDGDREILLQVPGPQRQVAAAAPAAPQRGNARTAQPGRPNAAEQAREQQMRRVQIMEALERARQSGASQQVLEALERALTQGAVGERSVGVPGNTVIIRRNPVPDTTTSPARRVPDLR
jgi:hypothetical protein